MRADRCRYGPLIHLVVTAAAVSIGLGAFAASATIAAAACTGDTSGAGFATSYSYTPGSGACSYGDDFGSFVAAINPTDYAGSEMCGRYLRVTGPLGSVNVRIVDLCPTCATGDVDLNAAAFGAIGNPADGRVAITWKTIAAPVSGNVFLQISTGSNPFFLQLQPRQTRYGVASLEYLGPSGYVTARRETYNYFTVDGSLGVPVPLGSPFTVRLTDVNGQQMVLAGIPLVAGHLHAGDAQFPACDAADAPGARLPRALALHLPAPNPFRRSTVLVFDVPREGDVILRLYDASGRRVRTLVREHLAAGRHEAAWQGLDDAGRPLASGVYFCRLSAGSAVDQKRIVLAD
ncbi:MAG TPA: expansin EXLX1 family cellulose-binding protein [Candidatus Eisenbacteria bacterium]|jgi:expansin (peptidoglycan-binding protein)